MAARIAMSRGLRLARSSAFTAVAFRPTPLAVPTRQLPLGVRYLSLQSKPEQVKDAVESSAQQASTTVQNKAEDAAASIQDTAASATETLQNVDASAHSALVESLSAAGLKADELQQLGLAHWGNPVGWVTQLIDTVGTTTGLPWWGTIMATTLILRLIISPVTVAGQKNAIRLGNISPRMKALMDDVKHHKAAGDAMAMQRSVNEVQTLMRENKANPLKSLTPIAVQLPLMFSFFWAIEKIAKSGIDSFAHGGPWWTTDLTQPDPTWALPVISTAATLAVAELGFKLGTTSGGDQSQTKMVKTVMRIAMPLIGWFSTTFPSGVLLYWATTNIWSLCQMVILQAPVVRRLVGMPKRIQHPKNPYAVKEKGILEKFREARNQMKDSRPVTAAPAPAPRASASRAEAMKEALEASESKAYEQNSSTDARKQRVLRARQRRGQ